MLIKTGIEAIDEANKKYPNRHKEIHKACCKHCPTEYNRANGLKDPETEDLKSLPKEVIAKDFLFVWCSVNLCLHLQRI